tara:strand:+ start:1273 stop:1551 length:279 start_codon:yes stop_codon:yes gene_type:complete
MSDLQTKAQLKNAYGAPKKSQFENESDYLLAKEDWVNSNPDQYDEIRLAYTQADMERAQSRGEKLFPRDPSSLVPEHSPVGPRPRGPGFEIN